MPGWERIDDRWSRAARGVGVVALAAGAYLLALWLLAALAAGGLAVV